MKWLSVLLLIAGTNLAFADDSSPPSDDFPLPPDTPAASAPASSEFSIDTPIEVLASSPAAASVLEQQLPGLLEDPSYPLFKRMCLKTVASLSGGRISAADLQQIDAELKATQSGTKPIPVSLVKVRSASNITP
jgi:hypothetical protein